MTSENPPLTHHCQCCLRSQILSAHQGEHHFCLAGSLLRKSPVIPDLHATGRLQEAPGCPHQVFHMQKRVPGHVVGLLRAHSLPCAGRLLVIPGSSLFPTPAAAARETLLSMLLSVKSWNLLASAASVLSVLPHKQLRAIGLQGMCV